MNNYTKILLFVYAILVSIGCNRTMYVPNMQNVPMLREKGEIRANFSTSNYQAAYGLMNGFGIMLNGHNPNLNSFTELTEDRSGSKYLIEAGIGHFRPMRESGIFEIYAGGGQGIVSFDNRNDMVMDKFSTKFARYFVQSSIGLSHGIIEVSFSIRLSNLRFFDKDASEYEFDPSNEFDQDLNEIDNHTYTYIEPAATFKIGRPDIKAFL